ncbi:MAG UNVERIFIED_CONTAM: hypothetical protein LVR18_02460 [Planctomycetaceae bacterium]
MFTAHNRHRTGLKIVVISVMILGVAGCGDQKRRAESLVRAGTAAPRAGDHAAAVQSSRRHLPWIRGLRKRSYGRGVSQAALGLHAAAIDSLHTAVKLKPAWPEAWFALATAQRAYRRDGFGRAVAWRSD